MPESGTTRPKGSRPAGGYRRQRTTARSDFVDALTKGSKKPPAESDLIPIEVPRRILHLVDLAAQTEDLDRNTWLLERARGTLENQLPDLIMLADRDLHPTGGGLRPCPRGFTRGRVLDHRDPFR